MAENKEWWAGSPAQPESNNDEWWKGTPEAKQGDGPLVRGWNKMTNSVGISSALATGDADRAADLVAEGADYAQKNQSRPEGQELMAAWERGDGILGGLKEVGKEFADDWNKANGVVGGTRETLKNVRAMGEGIVEQVPNMIAPVTGMVAGAAAGGAAGTAAPLVGNAAGVFLGGWAGATAGNAMVEGGGMLMDRLHKAGINPADKAAVAAFVRANGDDVAGDALIKGGIIGAVDVFTAGFGGRILNAPAKAATDRALKGMGVDMADKAAVAAAKESPEFLNRVAQDATYQGSKKGAGNMARNVGVGALDPAGEFAGEFLGTGVATGEWDTKNAALEAFSSIGQSAIMFAGQKAYQAMRSPGKPEASEGAEAPAADAKPLMLTMGNDPLVGFPDGTVGRRSEVEAYINGLPENERVAARAKLYGYGAQPVAQNEPEPLLALGNDPDPLFVFPDGTTGRRTEVEAYIEGMPESERMAARARMLGYSPQPAETGPVNSDEFLQAMAEHGRRPVEDHLAEVQRLVRSGTSYTSAQTVNSVSRAMEDAWLAQNADGAGKGASAVRAADAVGGQVARMVAQDERNAVAATDERVRTGRLIAGLQNALDDGGANASNTVLILRGLNAALGRVEEKPLSKDESKRMIALVNAHRAFTGLSLRANLPADITAQPWAPSDPFASNAAMEALIPERRMKAPAAMPAPAPQTPAEAAGINAADGPMSSVAAVALNTGAVQAAQAQQQAQQQQADSSRDATDIRDLAAQFWALHGTSGNGIHKTFASVLEKFAGEVESGKRERSSVDGAMAQYRRMLADAQASVAGQPAQAEQAPEPVNVPNAVLDDLVAEHGWVRSSPADRINAVHKLIPNVAIGSNHAREFSIWQADEGKLTLRAGIGFEDIATVDLRGNESAYEIGAAAMRLNQAVEEKAQAMRRELVTPRAAPAPAPAPKAPLEPAVAVDLKGFTRTELPDGGFELRDGDMVGRAEKTESGRYRVHYKNSRSLPTLTEQAVVNWLDATRAAVAKAAEGNAQPAPNPSAEGKIPDAVRAALNAKLLPLSRIEYGLTDARKSDAQFNGQGRYAAEFMQGKDAQIQVLKESIAKAVDSIKDEKNKAAAQAFFDERMPDLTLTEQEQGYLDRLNGANTSNTSSQAAPQPTEADSKRAKAVDRVKRGTAYFMTRAKAEAFLDDNTLRDGYQVEQRGAEFHIVAMGQPDPVNDPIAESQRKFGPQPVPKYWLEKTAGNAVRIRPPVGGSFQPHELNALKKWAENAGWEARIDGKTVKAISPEFRADSWRGFPESDETNYEPIQAPEISKPKPEQGKEFSNSLEKELNEARSQFVQIRHEKGESSEESKAAEKHLRSLRQGIFDAEDVLEAARNGDANAIAKIESLGFRQTAKELMDASAKQSPQESKPEDVAAAAARLKDFVFSLGEVPGMTDRAQIELGTGPLAKSGRDSILMEALGIGRAEAHDANNALDVRKPNKLSAEEVQAVLRDFPKLKELVDSAIAANPEKRSATENAQAGQSGEAPANQNKADFDKALANKFGVAPDWRGNVFKTRALAKKMLDAGSLDADEARFAWNDTKELTALVDEYGEAALAKAGQTEGQAQAATANDGDTVVDGLRVYRVANQGPVQWAAQTPENAKRTDVRVFGDTLHATREQAIEAARRAAADARERDEAAKQDEASKAKAAEAKAADAADDLNGFLEADLPGFQKARIKGNLSKEVSIQGRAGTLREHVERLHAEGELHVEHDEEAGKFYVNGMDMGKTAHDYAAHLRGTRLAAEDAKRDAEIEASQTPEDKAEINRLFGVKEEASAKPEAKEPADLSWAEAQAKGLREGAVVPVAKDLVLIRARGSRGGLVYAPARREQGSVTINVDLEALGANASMFSDAELAQMRAVKAEDEAKLYDSEREKYADSLQLTLKNRKAELLFHTNKISLFLGHNAVTARPLYSATKYDTITVFDPDAKQAGNLFTSQEIEVLRAEMEKHKQADEAAFKANPDGPFADAKQSVVGSASVDSRLVDWLQALADSVGFTNRIFLMDSEDTADFGRYKLHGPYHAARGMLRQHQTAGQFVAFGPDNNDVAIDFNSKHEVSESTETIAHELGHAIEHFFLKDASPETREALREAHQKWLKENTSKSKADFVHAMRSRFNAKRLVNNLAEKDAPVKTIANQGYWFGFSEWFADQTARWATSEEKPLGLVEQFFSDLGAKIRQILSFMTGKKHLPDRVVADYLNSLAPVTPVPQPDVLNKADKDLTNDDLKDIFKILVDKQEAQNQQKARAPRKPAAPRQPKAATATGEPAKILKAPKAPKAPKKEAPASDASIFAGPLAKLGGLFAGGKKASESDLEASASIDPDVYSQAKEAFDQCLVLAGPGSSLVEVMARIIKVFSDQYGIDAVRNMEPYVLHYIQQVRDGLHTKGEGKDAGTAIHKDGADSLEGVAPNDGGRAEGSGNAESASATGEPTGSGEGGRADGKRVPATRGGGGGASRVRSSGAGGRGGRRVKGEKAADAVASGERLTPEQADEAIKDTAPTNVPRVDFTIDASVELGKGTESVKFRDNVAAIKLLKELEAANRIASPSEQRTLARYVGWGGLKNAFRVAGSAEGEGVAKGWEKEVAEIEALLTPQELRAARNSTTAAHYTSQTIVEGMWSAVKRLGFAGGAVLEPSVGTGNFLGLMPQDLRGTSNTFAVEYDSLTARIAQQLYPNASIVHSGFQNVPVPEGKFALAIGNPPFGKESLHFRYDPSLSGKSIHNQFFLSSLKSLAPGGVMGMVVSRYLLDAKDASSRLAMAAQAEFLGAIRLPDTAFSENARTSVVTDMVFFRKRDAAQAELATMAIDELKGMTVKGVTEEMRGPVDAIKAEISRWVNSTEQNIDGVSLPVNGYFMHNPNMVVGKMDASGTMQGRQGLNVTLDDPSTMAARMNQAIGHLPKLTPANGVQERTLASFKQMANAMRLAVNRSEPGAVSIKDGRLSLVVEMEDSATGKGLLNEIELTADTPWDTGYTLTTEGKWEKTVNKLDEKGNPIKQVNKDGKVTNLNVKEVKSFDSLKDVPAKEKWGESRIAIVRSMLPVRDAMKRQLALEASDAPKAMIEANRKALNNAYDAFKKAHGTLHKSGNIGIALSMPDGGLILAAEELAPDAPPAKAGKSAIMSRRVTTPPKAVDRVENVADAVAVVLGEMGRLDVARVASLLGVTEAQAIEQLSAGENPRAFFNPETQTWEAADLYLSGLVRRKLLAAEAEGLTKNAEALRKSLPPDWDSTQITPNIGSAWIPESVYADFAKHLGFAKATVRYQSLTNSFSVNTSGNPSVEWATQNVPISEVLTRLLNSRGMKVMKRNSDKQLVLDEEATTEATIKARELSNEFLDWAFTDDTRRETLVRVFNDKYNTRVVRQRDGSHLKLPGKVPDAIIKMRRHQRNAIWRGITDASVLYDHVVGAGKTFTAIARIMERRRMGLSKKPMVVVPNHLVEQWALDATKLYPGANILAAGKSDFEAKNRRRLFARIGAGDYDMVIIGHSSFGFIDIDPATEERYIDEALREANAAVKEAEEQAAEDGAPTHIKPFNVAQAERLVKKLEERLAKVRENKRDRLLTFEEMGVDDLTIDEAHEFKNLAYSSNLSGVSGMGNKTGSGKAMDLNLKLRSMRERPGTSVAFLTGTPISNSVAEMYLVLKNLAPQELKDMGLDNFDAWRTMFVSASEAYEPTESGSLKAVTRLGREWMNMKSLMDLYYSVSDAVTLDDIKQAYAEENKGRPFPVPVVRSQREGNGDREMVAVKPSPEQRAMLRDIVDGFNELPDIKDLKVRNSQRLRLMDRARKVALDPRAVNPRAVVGEAGGKIKAVVDRTKGLYDKWNHIKGTQIVFLDRSVPSAKGDAERVKAYDKLMKELHELMNSGDADDAAVGKIHDKLAKFDPNEMEELRTAAAGGWNAYREIKEQLIAQGIPANEIRFVQEANTDDQKAALFAAVRSGEVRVLIGSTPRMGAGTNVQDRLVGLHHVDVTWKPSDIEQREGRIIRQGNLFASEYLPNGDKNPNHIKGFEVEVIAYATEMTVDAKMWSLNATKLKAINGIRKYDGSFEMQFEDEESASMAEMAALATGNPLMVEKVTLGGDIQRIEQEERAFARRINGMRGLLKKAKDLIENGDRRVASKLADASYMRKNLEAVKRRVKERHIMVEGVRYDRREDAAQSIEDAIAKQQDGNDKARYSISVNGEKFTNREKLKEQIDDSFGDLDFEFTINGKTVLHDIAAAKAVMEVRGDASSRGAEYVLSGMELNGMPFELEVSPSTWSSSKQNISAAILNEQGQTIHSSWDSVDVGPITTRQVLSAIRELTQRLMPTRLEGEAERLQEDRDEAKKDAPGLEVEIAKEFPRAKELTEKRARLQAVEATLAVSNDASRLTDDDAVPQGAATPEQGADGLDFAPESGSPYANASRVDRAVMEMVAGGREAREVLRLIAGTSASKGMRRLASLLLKAGVNPALSMEDRLAGGAFGRYFSDDRIALTPRALRDAEHIFMHEMMHAATVRALKAGGLMARRMEALFKQVLAKAEGRPEAREYGLKDVYEFVAEAFTNREFQAFLKSVEVSAQPAQKDSLWNRFIRLLKAAFGVGDQDQNALAAVVEIGVPLMRRDMEIRRRDGSGPVTGFESADFNPSAYAKSVGQGIKGMTATSISDAAGNKATDWLGVGLQFLGRRQLTEIYRKPLPQLDAYDRLAAKMDSDKNDVGAAADELARTWGKLKDEDKLADLMHDATLAQIDADSKVPYEAGDDKAQSTVLKARFNQLTPDAQRVYREVRESYKSHQEEVRKALVERMERASVASSTVEAIRKKMNAMGQIKGVYFPLARFGKYGVLVRKQDGSVAAFMRAESMGEAEAIRADALKQFPASKGFNVGPVRLSKDFVGSRDMVGRGFMEDVYKALDKQDLTAEQRSELEDTLGQLYLSSLPDVSWAKHTMKRKGTAGFSNDARRAFAQNTYQGARYLAKLRYGDLMSYQLGKMQDWVDDKADEPGYSQPRAQRVVDEMNKRHEAMMNPKANALSSALTSFGFIYFLGLSPAAAMVNLSQTPLVALPIMGAKWGFSKASAALLKTSKEAMLAKNNMATMLKGDELKAFDDAVREGVIDVTQAHDLAGIAQGEDAKVMWKIRPVMRAAGFLFHHAERFNRQTTFIAAYRLARAAGSDHTKAYKEAAKATYDGHFDFAAGNRPRIMQGNVAKVVLLFKQFAQNMIYTLARNAHQSVAGESPAVRKQARKVFAGLMVTHAMAAGVLGLPMVGTLLAVASALGSDEDDPWDAEVALRNMLAETFGQKPAEVMARGVSRLTPWDVSGRVGLSGLLLPDVQEGLGGQRWAEAFMTGALGPVAGIGVNFAKAAQKMAEGDYGRGLEDMLPVVLRNQVKALRYADEGAMDRTGVAIKDEVSTAGILGQSAGFSPSEVRLANEGKNAVFNQDRSLVERRGELMAQFARAAMEQDAAGMAEARAAVAKFNQTNPSRRILPQQLWASVNARQKRIREADNGVYLARTRRDAMEAGAFAFGE